MARTKASKVRLTIFVRAQINAVIQAEATAKEQSVSEVVANILSNHYAALIDAANQPPKEEPKKVSKPLTEKQLTDAALKYSREAVPTVHQPVSHQAKIIQKAHEINDYLMAGLIEMLPDGFIDHGRGVATQHQYDTEGLEHLEQAYWILFNINEVENVYVYDVARSTSLWSRKAYEQYMS